MGLRCIQGEFSEKVSVEPSACDSLSSQYKTDSRRAELKRTVEAVVEKPKLSHPDKESVGLMPSPTKFCDMPNISSLRILESDEKRSVLSTLNEQQVRGCTRCRLHENRTQTVFGEGDVDAPVFFIGEGPGENEDQTGRPFVGRAGQLLDKMIAAMGLAREQMFIANIVKCRPPDNRVPLPDEVETCTPYLVRQLEVVRPKVIVTLGLPAVKYMLGTPKITMGSVRGRWHSWRGIKLMPTYHPSYVLRNYTDATRQAVWSDLQMVMSETGLVSRQGKQ